VPLPRIVFSTTQAHPSANWFKFVFDNLFMVAHKLADKNVDAVQ